MTKRICAPATKILLQKDGRRRRRRFFCSENSVAGARPGNFEAKKRMTGPATTFLRKKNRFRRRYRTFRSPNTVAGAGDDIFASKKALPAPATEILEQKNGRRDRQRFLRSKISVARAVFSISHALFASGFLAWDRGIWDRARQWRSLVAETYSLQAALSEAKHSDQEEIGVCPASSRL